MDLAEYRKVSHATWERMAAGWDRRRAWMWDVSHAVGEQMVSKLDPQPGQTVLEVAAGTGETGFAAAARLGDDGRLISTDFSAPMVEAARRRADELELSNVEFRVMDAEHMSLADDSVDGVLCRWGYMLMADPAAALAETRRVLRPGGRLCLSVWGPADDNQWAVLSRTTLLAAGHAPAAGARRPGHLRHVQRGADPRAGHRGGVRQRGDRAGPRSSRGSRTSTITGASSTTSRAPSRWCSSGSAPTSWRRSATRTEQRAEPWRSNGGYVMPGVALNAVAS